MGKHEAEGDPNEFLPVIEYDSKLQLTVRGARIAKGWGYYFVCRLDDEDVVRSMMVKTGDKEFKGVVLDRFNSPEVEIKKRP